MSKKFLFTICCGIASLFAANVTVNPSEEKQTVIGFGGGVVYYQNWFTALPETEKQALYDTAFTGLNLSMLRLGNWLQGEDATVSEHDIEIATAAKTRLGDHLKIEMSSWSAPAYLKPSNDVNGAQNDVLYDTTEATLKTSTTNSPYGNYVYKEFASWWKQSIISYQEAGIPIDYISMQNEPDMFAKYEETLFAPSETEKLAGYAEALAALRDTINTLANPPKIIGPEPLGIGYNTFQNYMAKIDKNDLDGYAYHLYHAGNDNDNSALNYISPENYRDPMTAIATGYNDKPIIMTEFCTMLGEEREVDMVGLAHIMQVGFTAGNLSAYIAWELMWGEGRGQLIGVCTNGWGNCKENKITISPEYHGLRHYSKFVNPGWKVITTSTQESALKTVAFTNSTKDSISLIVINTGNSEITLEDLAISGYGVITAVQSTENGKKSFPISISSCYTLPPRSITTLVYKKGASEPDAVGCEDETSEDFISDPEVETPAGSSIIIADFSKDGLGTWEGDVATAPSLVTQELDGVSSYVEVPLAGCDQSEDECGYQNVRYTMLPELANNSVLQYCETLTITARGITETNYVNVGAVGTSWLDYEYGKTASVDSWSEITVSLEKEADALNGSTQIKFNSNNSGIYISKIVANNCSVPEEIANALGDRLPIHLPTYTAKNTGSAVLFDLNGNVVWKGKHQNILDTKGLLTLPVEQGIYILKTSSGNFKTIKH